MLPKALHGVNASLFEMPGPRIRESDSGSQSEAATAHAIAERNSSRLNLLLPPRCLLDPEAKRQNTAMITATQWRLR
jgi:hypothetical protein